MDISLFDFYLPPHLIAQYPANRRENARLITINSNKQTYKDEHFFDILNYLNADDVLVINNTKVIPARLQGVKIPTGAKVEIIILKNIGDDIYEVLIGNARAVRIGTEINVGDGKLKATCVGKFTEGIHHVKFTYDGILLEVLEEVGTMPLPPYIEDDKKKYERYQTVYATNPGSAAAPTAGFHFTEEILKALKQKGVQIIELTLHIGLGTFRPVTVTNTDDHVMHYEEYEISETSAKALNEALAANKRIISVGTTSTRALEANFLKYNKIVATREATNLFITPGFKFNVVSALITNFHLPKSTLLMLVSAFANRELMLEVYHHAINNNYRFFSFGDVMYIYGKD